MPLQIHYPFKPFKITQHWGALNGAYAAQFNDPSFKRHNGVDANVGKFDWQGKIVSEYPVYCPVEGFRVASVEYYPNGGGHQIGLVSKERRRVGDKFCYVSILLCHAKKILVPVGYEPALGELLMIADNTGFSTGIHTHIGLYRLDDTLNKLDANEATGSTDPALFFTDTFAADEATWATLFRGNMRYYQYRLGLSG